MYKRNHVAVLAACASLFITGDAALASKEGAAVADAVVWIILVGGASFALLTLAGGLIGVVKSRKRGGSLLKGAGVGVLKGALAFAALCGVLWVLGMLYIAYAVLIY